MKKLISAALSVLMLTALTVAASADIAPMPREVQQIRWVLPVLAVAVVASTPPRAAVPAWCPIRGGGGGSIAMNAAERRSRRS